jgi:hypothetical protein
MKDPHRAIRAILWWGFVGAILWTIAGQCFIR